MEDRKGFQKSFMLPYKALVWTIPVYNTAWYPPSNELSNDAQLFSSSLKFAFYKWIDENMRVALYKEV